MNTRWDILGIGVVAVDDLLYVDHYPEPDTKMQIQTQRREGGGLAGTALVAAARLGAKAAYFGILGEDELSRFTRQELTREGVDCSAVLFRDEARPYHSVIIVVPATGQRTILYTDSGVHRLPPAEITDDLMANCRVLFVDHTVVEEAFHAVELAHNHHISVVGDFEANRHPRTLDLMDQIDHLVIGVDFARQITGKNDPKNMVRALSRFDRACCVVTAGEQGCWYVERDGEVRHFPAFQVQVVDTTGCGDVFHGAYAACLARGESIPQAIRVATAAAGIKATQPGGRSGIPNRATLDRFLQEYSA